MSVEYVKFNSLRKKEFAIKTIVENNNGNKRVIKEGLTPFAYDFINTIANNQSLMEGMYKDLKICQSEVKDNKVIFDFIEGETLQEHILQTIEDNDKKKFVDILYDYKYILMDNSKTTLKKALDNTNEFRQIFNIDLTDYSFEYLPVSNIDMSFDNLLINGEDIIVIDYEWVFNFPLPINYIIFRNVITLYNKYKSKIERKGFISCEEIFKLFSINDKDIEIFQQMEVGFQTFVHGCNTKVYTNYLKDAVYLKDLTELKKSMSDVSVAQLFWDDGNGFNEDNVINVELNIKYPDDIKLEFSVDSMEGIHESPLRIDVCKLPCAVKIYKAYYVTQGLECEMELSFSNSNIADDGAYGFFHDDPQLIYNQIQYTELPIDKIILEFKFIDLYSLTGDIINMYDAKEKELNELNQNLTFYNSELEANKLELEANKLELEANKLELETNKSELETNKSELETNKSELETNKLELEACILSLENSNNNLKITVEESTSKICELGTSIDAYISKNNELTHNLSNSNNEIVQKKEELDKIYSSKSWKMVSVLRKIRHFGG